MENRIISVECNEMKTPESPNGINLRESQRPREPTNEKIN